MKVSQMMLSHENGTTVTLTRSADGSRIMVRIISTYDASVIYVPVTTSAEPERLKAVENIFAAVFAALPGEKTWGDESAIFDALECFSPQSCHV